MAQVDAGVGTGNAQILAPNSAQNLGVEVHVSVGTNPLGPASAPYRYPSACPSGSSAGSFAAYETTSTTIGLPANVGNQALVFANPA